MTPSCRLDINQSIKQSLVLVKLTETKTKVVMKDGDMTQSMDMNVSQSHRFNAHRQGASNSIWILRNFSWMNTGLEFMQFSTRECSESLWLFPLPFQGDPWLAWRMAFDSFHYGYPSSSSDLYSAMVSRVTSVPAHRQKWCWRVSQRFVPTTIQGKAWGHVLWRPRL